jgi:hypothetical protein
MSPSWVIYFFPHLDYNTDDEWYYPVELEPRGVAMNIGKQRRTIYIEPIEEPAPGPVSEPETAPAEPVETPAQEPVPTPA